MFRFGFHAGDELPHSHTSQHQYGLSPRVVHWFGCYLVSKKKKSFRFWYVFSFGLLFRNIRRTWKLHVHSIVSKPSWHDQFKMTKRTKYENRQYVTPLSQKYKAMRRVIQHKQTDQEEKSNKTKYICIYIYSEVQFDEVNKYSPVQEGERKHRLNGKKKEGGGEGMIF